MVYTVVINIRSVKSRLLCHLEHIYNIAYLAQNLKMSSIKNLIKFMDVAKYVVKGQGFKFYNHVFRYSH